MGLRVSQPGDSENQLRSAYFFQKLFFFGIFLTTILKIKPKIKPKINPNIINGYATARPTCWHGLWTAEGPPGPGLRSAGSWTAKCRVPYHQRYHPFQQP